METLLETLSVINSPEIQTTVTILRWIFGIIGAILILFSLFVLMRTMFLRYTFLFDFTEFFTFRPYGLRRVFGKWQKIQIRLESTNEAEYKLAVIEADGMLSDILLRMGFQGETLGDRLRTLSTAIIPNLDDAIHAHQTRNKVVHDPDYQLTLEETQRTLEIYETAFRNLDLI